MTDPIITPEQRAANIDQARAANQANAVTGIHGMSGAGKSGLADTAAEYAHEEFRKITLCYAADLGGFGNKRLSLIHAGILRVYDPRNHVNPFETMELISLGAWPETIIDPERGFAAPDVKLILPRRIVYVVSCAQGHEVTRVDDQVALQRVGAACPVCGLTTDITNAKVEQVIVRHRMFRDVGLRIYDSFTALGEWGLADLQEQSAKGLLPTTSSGGSLLGSADALVSGQFRFGSSSEGQYGFVQNRVYGWLANIRTIPDQVVPAVATFLVELSKESKRGMGDLHYGPKIPGQAGTAALPPKLGNCLHASREPFNASDPNSPMVFRLWLTNHLNATDRIPYVAKHRGAPMGMPDYLEDKPGEPPWTGFSLKTLFRMLDQQLKTLDAQLKQTYPDASHQMWTGEVAGEGEEIDEVVGKVTATVGGGGPVRISGGGANRLRGRLAASAAGAAPAAVPAPPPVVAAPVVAPQPTQQTTQAAPPAQQTVPVSPSAPVTQEQPASTSPGTAPAAPLAPPPAPAAISGRSRLRAARPPAG